MWEYDRKVIKFKAVQELLAELNTLGARGWEIISYEETKPKKFGGNMNALFYLKKRNHATKKISSNS